MAAKPHNKALFIFHRSLRLEDNLGLIRAVDESKQVIPIFIFTKEQVINNPYRSLPAIQFMMSSLKDLEQSIKKCNGRLLIFFGNQQIINKLIRRYNIDAVYIDKDYTKYAKHREEEIEKICRTNNCAFYSVHDILMHPIEGYQKNDKNGEIYKKFTPFFKKFSSQAVDRPLYREMKGCLGKPNISIDEQTTIDGMIQIIGLEWNDSLIVGSRAQALEILGGIKKFKDYNKTRNYPHIPTTKLSAYLKFGLVSIRETYHHFIKLGKNNDLVKQLFWRDFYQVIASSRPDIFEGKSFQPRFDAIKWDTDKVRFDLWKKGKTGYPIVDAGMRELNSTGFMHNRCRLICGSFLVKHLHLDWRWGEKYFAQKLIDYDPMINNGNWQWVAGTGADQQPYFRIFNPWLQSANFDGQALYIKMWIPELADVQPRHIHNWNVWNASYQVPYPEPCIDQSVEKLRTVKMYRVYTVRQLKC